MKSITNTKPTDEKKRILNDLFLECSQSEIKYIIRFILGNFKIGVGENIMQKSLTKAIFNFHYFNKECPNDEELHENLLE